MRSGMCGGMPRPRSACGRRLARAAHVRCDPGGLRDALGGISTASRAVGRNRAGPASCRRWNMRWTLLKAWFAGFVATTIITLMVYFVSPDLTGGPSDLAALIAGLLVVSWVTGLGAHFLIRTLV